MPERSLYFFPLIRGIIFHFFEKFISQRENFEVLYRRYIYSLRNLFIQIDKILKFNIEDIFLWISILSRIFEFWKFVLKLCFFFERKISFRISEFWKFVSRGCFFWQQKKLFSVRGKLNIICLNFLDEAS